LITDTVSKNDFQLLYDHNTEIFQLKNNLFEITDTEILTITLVDLKKIGIETNSNNGSKKSNGTVMKVGKHQIYENDEKKNLLISRKMEIQ